MNRFSIGGGAVDDVMHRPRTFVRSVVSTELRWSHMRETDSAPDGPNDIKGIQYLTYDYDIQKNEEGVNYTPILLIFTSFLVKMKKI